MNNWQELYLNQYVSQYNSFLELFMLAQTDIENKTFSYSSMMLEQYSKFFEETLFILQKFFQFNSLQTFENRVIVVYFLRCNILKNGYIFYDLYKKISEKKYTKTDITELFNIKYLEQFTEIKNFLEERIKKEEIYGIFD